MTTERRFYLCDLCHSEYSTEESAKGCEARHPKRLSLHSVSKFFDHDGLASEVIIEIDGILHAFVYAQRIGKAKQDD